MNSFSTYRKLKKIKKKKIQKIGTCDLKAYRAKRQVVDVISES